MANAARIKVQPIRTIFRHEMPYSRWQMVMLLKEVQAR
jgi:hypothetical protein